MRWTEERRSFIIEMAHTGVSHSTIARAAETRFGEPLSKCAVTAKLNRSAAYTPREYPIGRCKPVLPTVQHAPLPCVAAAGCAPGWLPPEAAKRVAVRREGYRADGTGCRFPIGDPRHPDFHFCDKPLSRITEDYCNACKDIAYKPRPSPMQASDGGAQLSEDCDRISLADLTIKRARHFN